MLQFCLMKFKFILIATHVALGSSERLFWNNLTLQDRISLLLMLYKNGE